MWNEGKKGSWRSSPPSHRCRVGSESQAAISRCYASHQGFPYLVVSNVNMLRRWSLSLLTVNTCLALLLMGSEELYDWHQYDLWQWEEQRSQRPFNPVLTKEAQQAITIDYWPAVRMRTFHALNFPMSILLGWYSHPISIHANSILGSFLLRVCQRLSVKRRVVILDAVLLFGVSLQWWLVGLWLERPFPLVRVLRIIAAAMTVLGIAAALVAIPRAVAEIAAIHGAVEVLSFVIAFGWVLLIVTGTVSVALTSARALRRACCYQ